MLKGLNTGRPLPSDTVHELTLTLCHELAHLLERSGGHGSKWRQAQDALVQAVLVKLGQGAPRRNGSGGGAPFGGCECCRPRAVAVESP